MQGWHFPIQSWLFVSNNTFCQESGSLSENTEIFCHESWNPFGALVPVDESSGMFLVVTVLVYGAIDDHLYFGVIV